MMQCICLDYGILSFFVSKIIFAPKMAVHVKKNTHSKEKSTARANNCTRIFVQFELEKGEEIAKKSH